MREYKHCLAKVLLFYILDRVDVGHFFTSDNSHTVLTVCCVTVVILGGEPSACLVVFLL